MMHRLIRSTILVLTLAIGATAQVANSSEPAFPRPAELERDIAFWRRIYTGVTTTGGLLHDPERLDVVYEVVQFPQDLSPRQLSKRVDDLKKKYARILDRLATAEEEKLSAEE